MGDHVRHFTHEVSSEEKGKDHVTTNLANANVLGSGDLESRESDRRLRASLVRCDNGVQVERRSTLCRGSNEKCGKGKPSGEAPAVVEHHSHDGQGLSSDARSNVVEFGSQVGKVSTLKVVELCSHSGKEPLRRGCDVYTSSRGWTNGLRGDMGSRVDCSRCSSVECWRVCSAQTQKKRNRCEVLLVEVSRSENGMSMVGSH